MNYGTSQFLGRNKISLPRLSPGLAHGFMRSAKDIFYRFDTPYLLH